jgi:G6PDH family F420-dependent oxidoreductase
MVQVGYAISSEEHSPLDLVNHARRAEEVGFDFAMISDHFHPWVPSQGNSPFVWSVLGGIAQATRRLRVGTGVTCPIQRIHPAIIAQASATAAAMMPGRFILGLGSGENLNEHILGDRWPNAFNRLEMLEEAIEIIRLLWEGGEQSYEGEYYTVEDAELYTLPDEPPPIYIAAAGEEALELAAEFGDGLITTDTESEMVHKFEEAGGNGKPRMGQIKVCWAESEAAARQTVQEWWPVSSVSGRLHSDLPTPSHFQDAVDLMGEIQIPASTILGPDPDLHLEAIRKAVEAGFDQVYVHQIGPDQAGFFQFYQREILPALEREGLLGRPVE